MRGRPSCLLQSAGVEANRILLASALHMGCVLFLLVRNRSLLKVMILFCVAVGRHNDG